MLADQLKCGRAAIFHIDDLGLCGGANRAFLELAAVGHVTCGSVMVPCPQFAALAEAAAADATLDLGVHLTLTSEWEHYRWSPLSTRSKASGLVDDDGYLWRDLRSLAAHLVVPAVEAELRLQIEHAMAAGLRLSHIDAHMAAAMLPQLLELHVRLAREYGLFPVLPRAIAFAPDPERYRETIAALEHAGLPVIDHFRGTLPVAGAVLAGRYRQMLAELPPGVTHVALHCTAPGEIELIAPQHAPWRINEYRLLASGMVTAWCEEERLQRIGMRALQALWRAADDAPARGAAIASSG